jgi:hypothetical protein
MKVNEYRRFVESGFGACIAEAAHATIKFFAVDPSHIELGCFGSPDRVDLGAKSGDDCEI